MKGGKSKEAATDDHAATEVAKTQDPRNSAKEKVVDFTVKVEKAMRCRRGGHDKCCYDKYNGSCGTYTADNIRVHSMLLVSCVTT